MNKWLFVLVAALAVVGAVELADAITDALAKGGW